jgi:hypothetical protein
VLFVGAGWTLNAEPHGRALTWKQLAGKINTTDLDPLWLAELYRLRQHSAVFTRRPHCAQGKVSAIVGYGQHSAVFTRRPH